MDINNTKKEVLLARIKELEIELLKADNVIYEQQIRLDCAHEQLRKLDTSPEFKYIDVD
jgi:hypothetical protein